MTINSDVQKSNPGDIVELFQLDVTPIGGGVHYFVRGTDGGQPVLWQGNTFMPRDFQVEGYELSSKGELPRPKLTLSHLNSTLLGLVLEFDGLVGAVLTRWRTFAKYLDNGSQPDPDSHFPVDVHILDRKTSQDNVSIEWELVAAVDQEGKKLPFRQILRDVCTQRYRFHDGEAFDYSAATCPYVGENCFDEFGAACDPEDDQCGKRLSDCKLRFPNEALPTWGFPGVGRSS